MAAPVQQKKASRLKKNGTEFYPYTHAKVVEIDNNGTKLSSVLDKIGTTTAFITQVSGSGSSAIASIDITSSLSKNVVLLTHKSTAKATTTNINGYNLTSQIKDGERATIIYYNNSGQPTNVSLTMINGTTTPIFIGNAASATLIQSSGYMKIELLNCNNQLVVSVG